MAAIIVLRSKNGEFEFLVVPSSSLLPGESSKYGKLEATLFEYAFWLFSVIKQVTNNAS